MIKISNIRNFNAVVKGWYEADIFDEEFGDSCKARWYVGHPNDVEFYGSNGEGMVGSISRHVDVDFLNVFEAFEAHHEGEKNV